MILLGLVRHLFLAKDVCNTRVSGDEWVQWHIWSTAVIWLQCSWRLSMPEVLEGTIIFCVIIWIGLPKSRDWGWGSVRFARAFISCWGTEFQRDWWEWVGVDVFSASDPHPFQDKYCAIIDTALKNLEYICTLFFNLSYKSLGLKHFTGMRNCQELVA